MTHLQRLNDDSHIRALAEKITRIFEPNAILNNPQKFSSLEYLLSEAMEANLKNHHIVARYIHQAYDDGFTSALTRAAEVARKDDAFCGERIATAIEKLKEETKWQHQMIQ